MKRDLYFCGDVHGDWNRLIWTIITRYNIRNSDIVILGDFGIGFDNTFSDWYERKGKKLEEVDDTIYVMRGNHDDPSYFKNPKNDEHPRVIFLEDHKVVNIAGYEIYPIGGASSTDVLYRQEINEERILKKKNLIWWEDEAPIEKRENLPDRVDVIISHTAPISFSPIPIRTSEIPDWQYVKINGERNYLQFILEEVKADYWFYGHYHTYYSGSYNELLWKGLGIMEFYKMPEKINKQIQGEII